MTYIILAAFYAVCAFAFTRRVLPTVVNAVVGLVLAYLCMPTLAWGFYGTVIFFALGLAAGWVWPFANYILSEYREPRYSFREVWVGSVGVWTFLAVAAVAVPIFQTWGLFTDKPRYDLATAAVEGVHDFDPSSLLLDTKEAQFVDEGLAVRRMNELCGQYTSLCSQTDFGKPKRQWIAGKVWWVAPLEHENPLKWFSNRTVPGYAMVSVTDYSDAKIVLGHNQSIGMGGFYFGNYLPRFLYENGFALNGYEDYSYELDDAGKPAWVVTKNAPKIGFSGFVATGVIVVDPENRTFKEYGIADAPEWINLIQPESITEDRLADWGWYKHGWKNSWMGGLDVLKVTRESSAIVMTTNGRLVRYTGLQSSSGNSESTMGFALTDMRTGKINIYKRAGITESAAKKALEGMVQDKKYTASEPIPYNVFGKTTFISLLKDAAGNRVAIGMIAYDNREIRAVGEVNDLESALLAYKFAVRSRGTVGLEQVTRANRIAIEGKITYLSREIGKAGTVVVFLLDSQPTKGFEVLSTVSPETRFSREGDKVRIWVENMSGAVVEAVDFDNLGIRFEAEPVTKK